MYTARHVWVNVARRPGTGTIMDTGTARAASKDLYVTPGRAGPLDSPKPSRLLFSPVTCCSRSPKSKTAKASPGLVGSIGCFLANFLKFLRSFYSGLNPGLVPECRWSRMPVPTFGKVPFLLGDLLPRCWLATVSATRP
jgi:hypothetical protein